MCITRCSIGTSSREARKEQLCFTDSNVISWHYHLFIWMYIHIYLIITWHTLIVLNILAFFGWFWVNVCQIRGDHSVLCFSKNKVKFPSILFFADTLWFCHCLASNWHADNSRQEQKNQQKLSVSFLLITSQLTVALFGHGPCNHFVFTGKAYYSKNVIF